MTGLTDDEGDGFAVHRQAYADLATSLRLLLDQAEGISSCMTMREGFRRYLLREGIRLSTCGTLVPEQTTWNDDLLDLAVHAKGCPACDRIVRLLTALDVVLHSTLNLRSAAPRLHEGDIEAIVDELVHDTKNTN